MVKVIGKYQQDPTLEASVKTIAVHEDYRPYSTNILHPEPNNIGENNFKIFACKLT